MVAEWFIVRGCRRLESSAARCSDLGEMSEADDAAEEEVVMKGAGDDDEGEEVGGDGDGDGDCGCGDEGSRGRWRSGGRWR